LTTTAGDNFRAEEEQLIQQEMQAIGLDVAIQNVPVPLLTGGFAANSWLNLGSFDIVILMGGYYTDPQSAMLGYFGSNAVPNPQTQSGNNFSRVQDPAVDQALATAGSTVDTQARIAAYTTFSRLVAADAGTIPLYGRLETDAHSTALQGWQTDVNDYLTWNAQDWWLKP
jgi:ABC-type transport system substrate-binding protein